MNVLSGYREEIDQIDEKLVQLLQRRMTIAGEIGKIKESQGLMVRDPKRERLILDRISAMVENPAHRERILMIIRSVLEASRALQDGGRAVSAAARDTGATVSAGYAGVPGAFAETALIRYFGERSEPYVSFPTFQEVCDAILSGEIRYGMLPVENTTTGAINAVYDLIREKELFITGEICVPVVHHLIGHKGTELHEIREVYSHPQGLEQCSQFLERLSEVQLIPMTNTAFSVRHVADSEDHSKGAIASERAAEIYGLEILQRAIQNSSVNATRFVVLASQPVIDEDADSSSFVLTAHHSAGSLYDILGCFAKEQVNLFRIESRPVPDRPWEYFIYLDAEGTPALETMQRAVSQAREFCPYFRYLGSYRKGTGS